MKRRSAVFLALAMLLAFSGCAQEGQPEGPEPAATENGSIPFLDGQLYAVAYLGYQEMGELSYYAEHYLDSEKIPIHYFSPGDFYLILPRYTTMDLALYQNDMDTMGKTLKYEEQDCRPFIIQCNVSDIFPDASICFTYGEESVEFSPFISLKDGSLVVGERGLDLTQ